MILYESIKKEEILLQDYYKILLRWAISFEKKLGYRNKFLKIFVLIDFKNQTI